MNDNIEKLALVVQQLTEVVKSQQEQLNLIYTKLDYQHKILYDQSESLSSLSETVKDLSRDIFLIM